MYQGLYYKNTVFSATSFRERPTMAPLPQCVIAQDLLAPSTFGCVVAAVEYGLFFQISPNSSCLSDGASLGALLVMSRQGSTTKLMLALRLWIVASATSAFALQITWLALHPNSGSALVNCLYLALNIM